MSDSSILTLAVVTAFLGLTVAIAVLIYSIKAKPSEPEIYVPGYPHKALTMVEARELLQDAYTRIAPLQVMLTDVEGGVRWTLWHPHPEASRILYSDDPSVQVEGVHVPVMMGEEKTTEAAAVAAVLWISRNRPSALHNVSARVILG